MPVALRSFAKINLGLAIGPRRRDGYHQLRTIYQTIALHDVVRVRVAKGTGIEIVCRDERVPRDESNTCYQMAQKVLRALGARGRVTIEIEKKLPVQGGLGGASSNAVCTLLALERALGKPLRPEEKLRLAAAVGSDLPLFLVGGTVLGVGRGEDVYPLADLPPIPCVLVTPEVAISTPQAFADWDLLAESGRTRAAPAAALTGFPASARMNGFSRSLAAWLGGLSSRQGRHKAVGRSITGVPARGGGGRAETLLLDLVRTGIENDFERVVFPQYPELRGVKRVLGREGAGYASLSGSGSAIYGLFASQAAAQRTARRLRSAGIPVQVTTTLTRQQYWTRLSF